MFMGMDIVVEMRTKFTQLVRVGGVISGSSPSASKQAIPKSPTSCRDPHVSGGGLGYETDQLQGSCFRG